MTSVSWTRPLAALATATTILALLAIATWTARRPRTEAADRDHAARTSVPVQIELTIAGHLASDGFSLQGTNGLRVQLDGVTILERDSLAAESISITREATTNESHAVTFEAAVRSVASAAVRVRVRQGLRELVERSWWSEAGEPLSGELSFRVTDHETPHSH